MEVEALAVKIGGADMDVQDSTALVLVGNNNALVGVVNNVDIRASNIYNRVAGRDDVPLKGLGRGVDVKDDGLVDLLNEDGNVTEKSGVVRTQEKGRIRVVLDVGICLKTSSLKDRHRLLSRDLDIITIARYVLVRLERDGSRGGGHFPHNHHRVLPLEPTGPTSS